MIKGGMGDITVTITVDTETGWSLALTETMEDDEGEFYSNFRDAAMMLEDLTSRARAALIPTEVAR